MTDHRPRPVDVFHDECMARAEAECPTTPAVAAAIDQTAPPAAVWIDGDPLMEAIASAVWEQCRTDYPSSVVDDPRNIAAVAAAAIRAHQAAEAPATDEERRERYATAISKWHRDPEQALYVQGADAVIAVADAEQAELRRMADEAQQPWLSDSARIGRTLIWTWSDIGKGSYGEGYRAAQAQARALLTGRRDSSEAQQPKGARS